MSRIINELENKFYRVEYFDHTNKFVKYKVVSAETMEQCVRDMDDPRYPLIKVYRCNEKGNNYSGRLVCTLVDRKII